MRTELNSAVDHVLCFSEIRGNYFRAALVLQYIVSLPHSTTTKRFPAEIPFTEQVTVKGFVADKEEKKIIK